MPVCSPISDKMQYTWKLFWKKQSIIHIICILYSPIGTVTQELTGCVLNSYCPQANIMLYLVSPIIVLTLCNSSHVENTLVTFSQLSRFKVYTLSILYFYLPLVYSPLRTFLRHINFIVYASVLLFHCNYPVLIFQESSIIPVTFL